MRNDYVKLLEFELEKAAEKEVSTPPAKRYVSKTGTETSDFDKIDKVIVELKAQEASALTKAAIKLKEIVDEKKKLEQLEEDLKDEARKYMEPFFSAEENVWTRVLETASILMTLSKETKRKTEKFDTDKFINETMKLVPELTDQIKKLREECTKITETIIKSGLKVTPKNESVEYITENIGEQLKKFWETIKNKSETVFKNVKNWSSSFDTKLSKIKTAVKGLEEQKIKEEEELIKNTIPVKITNWGIGLNNKFGITGVITFRATEDEIESNKKYAKERDGYIEIEYLDDTGKTINKEVIGKKNS